MNGPKKYTRRLFFYDSFFALSASLFFSSYPSFFPREKRLLKSDETLDYPSYIKLYRSGELSKRVKTLKSVYEDCHLCPRDCRVDRTQGQVGRCQASNRVKVSSAYPHFGEESPLVGKYGSGTIFFSNCGLRCIYCQNYTISIEGEGVEIADRRLADSMMSLQKMGCHNINLVTPTHYIPNMVSALEMAIQRGLKIPLVYNTGGYEKIEILQLLDGIIDIYMPDCKYMDPKHAAMYSADAYNYPYYVKIALKEMFRQVGDLVVERGIAKRGLIIRHLVLPNRIAGTEQFLQFVAEHLSKNTYLNIMRQYRPEHRASEYPELARVLKRKEYTEALQWAKKYGLSRLDR
ncbi:MAG: radical SAM protein [Candidatus Aminicenantes bacterium]